MPGSNYVSPTRPTYDPWQALVEEIIEVKNNDMHDTLLELSPKHSVQLLLCPRFAAHTWTYYTPFVHLGISEVVVCCLQCTQLKMSLFCPNAVCSTVNKHLSLWSPFLYSFIKTSKNGFHLISSQNKGWNITRWNRQFQLQTKPERIKSDGFAQIHFIDENHKKLDKSHNKPKKLNF